MTSQLQALSDSVRALGKSGEGSRREVGQLGAAAQAMSREVGGGSAQSPAHRQLHAHLAAAAKDARATDAALAAFAAKAHTYAVHLTGASMGDLMQAAWSFRGPLAKAFATEVLPTIVGIAVENTTNTDQVGSTLQGVTDIVKVPRTDKS